VGSLRLDRAVVDSVLEAIRPVGIDAGINMSKHAQAADNEKSKALELALERARHMKRIARGDSLTLWSRRTDWWRVNWKLAGIALWPGWRI
jgi:hypothetical protein